MSATLDALTVTSSPVRLGDSAHATLQDGWGVAQAAIPQIGAQPGEVNRAHSLGLAVVVASEEGRTILSVIGPAKLLAAFVGAA
jgi:hypothetical protein